MGRLCYREMHPLIVSSADDGALNHDIEINAATSRIQIDP